MRNPTEKTRESVVVYQRTPCCYCNREFGRGTVMIRRTFRGNRLGVKLACLACQSRIDNGGACEPRKFAVGDRVVYHVTSTGNADLDGKEGTVIYVDSRDYTVEFDCSVYDGVTDYRAREIGIEPRFESGWFCREEHLSRV